MALTKYSEISSFAADIMHAVEKAYLGTYCTITPLSNKACWKVVVTKLGSGGQQYYFQEYINQTNLSTAPNAKQLLMNVVDKCLEGLEAALPKGGPTITYHNNTSYVQYLGPYTTKMPNDYIYSAPKEKFQWSGFKPHTTVNEEKPKEMNSLKEMYAAAPVKAKKVKKPKVKMTAAQKEALKLNPPPPKPAIDWGMVNKIALDDIFKPNPLYAYIKKLESTPMHQNPPMIVTNKSTANLYKQALEGAANPNEAGIQGAVEEFKKLKKEAYLNKEKALFKNGKIKKILKNIKEVEEY